MKIRLGLISVATGTLLLAAVSACGGNAQDPSPSAPSSSLSAPASSAASTNPSVSATADATAIMRDYFAVVDEVGQDPTADLKRLRAVATSTQLSAIQTLLRSQHDQGQRQVGTTAINKLTVQSVNLDNSDSSAGKVPSVVIDVCWDVSKVDVLDKSGTSIVSPNRPDTGWTRYTVANYQYATDPTGGWRVATGQDLKQKPCAAS
jgi:hypothetical protein